MVDREPGDAGWYAWTARLVQAPPARLPAELVALVTGLAPGGAVSLRLGEDDVHASDARARELEQLQAETGQGPGAAVGPERPVVLVEDLVAAWPALAESLRGSGLRAALGLALVLDDELLGRLTVWAPGPEALPLSEDRAEALAALATAVVVLRRREQQLQEAIASRDVLGQAKGILMERLRLDADRAFQLLVSVSQRRNRKVRLVAAELAATGSVDPGDDGVVAAPATGVPDR